MVDNEMLKMNFSQLYEFKGKCPICDRDMYNAFSSIDRHHFVPKCKGGRETELIHVICHRKIHSLFTEAECAKEYSDPSLVKNHPEIKKFIHWVSKKDPFFNDQHKVHSNRKKKRYMYKIYCKTNKFNPHGVPTEKVPLFIKGEVRQEKLKNVNLLYSSGVKKCLE